MAIRYVILCAIVGVGAWSLLPPRDAAKAVRLGSDLTRNKSAPSSVKYVIRFNPGTIYLPGIMRENATLPIEGIAKVAAAFERLYPDTRIEFLGVPGDSREWLITQLSSGQAPDVMMTLVENVWQDTQKNWYVPLDQYLFHQPNPFVAKGQPGSVKWWDMFKYPIPTLGTMAPDGHMYCVVLDMIETGIFYNKNIFNRLGLHEPKDWVEFIEIQKTLKQAGYIPMLVDRQALADWGIDLVFDQVYGEMRDLLDLDYDPRRGEYLHGYLDWDELIFLHRKGFFSPADPRWQEVLRILKEWRPYMSQDINSRVTDFVKMFMTQKGAMYWTSGMMVPRLLADPKRGFDFGIFYLPPIPPSYSRFARAKDMCVIGGSQTQYCVTNSAYKDTGDPQSSERLKRVIAFLQFLTLPDNCRIIVNEHIAFLPNIKGVDPHPYLMPFHQFLQRRYAMTKWLYTFDNQWNEVLIRMLELHLNGGIDRQQLLALLEKDLDRTTALIERRKSLDIGRFQSAWDSRAELRKRFNELPHDSN